MSTLTRRLRFRRDHRWSPRNMSAFVDAELASGARARLLRSLERMLLRLGQVPSPASGEAPDLVANIQARLREPHGRSSPPP